MKIEIYQPHHQLKWDDFVSRSKNGHFQFYRNYLEYHSDRFQDHSLLIWDNKGNLVCLLPAHVTDSKFASHQGLTYGGFITDHSMKTPLMLDIFHDTINYIGGKGITHFIYKTIPHLYHKIPAEEDRYALFRLGAQLTKRNLFSVLYNEAPPPFQERRIRSINKAKMNNLVVNPTTDFTAFWNILSETLLEKHGVKPVHTLDEIIKLATLFPNNIKLYGCFSCTKMLAGVVIYEMENTVRSQYIAANIEGKDSGALDLIFDTLINKVYKDKKYFDFGPSDENNGLHLNVGLIDQKEGFGARGIVHDHYEIIL